MTKNIFILLILSTLILRGQFDNCPNKIIEAGNRDLNHFLELIPKGQEKEYGFEGTDSLTKSRLSFPYQILTINSDYIKSDNFDIDNAIIFTKTWRAPVIFNNHYVSLLTVIETNDGAKGVDFGARVMAKEIDLIENAYNMTQSTERFILRINQLRCDFVIIKEKDIALLDAQVIPLKSAQMALKNQPELINKKASLAELIKALKVIIRNS